MTIYEKIIQIQSELKAPKGKFNSFGKYKYRSAEDILEAVKPVLSKAGLYLNMTDEIVIIGDRIYLKATATVFDGSGLSVTSNGMAREPDEFKGMSEPQITGSASSYARKYALNGLFGIDESEADPDNDNKQDEPKHTTSEAQIKRLMTIAQKNGWIAEEVKTEYCKKYNVKSGLELNFKQYNEIVKYYETNKKGDVK